VKLAKLWKHPPFYIVRAAFDRVPMRPVTVNRLHLIRYDGIPQVPDGSVRGPAEVRAGRPEDIDALVRCMGERAMFVERFASGDRCAVAVVDGDIAGYEWFSTHPRHIVPPFGYTIEIPPGSVYAYDAYILPAYRLCGIWLAFKRHLAGLMRGTSRNRVLAYVEYGNDLSLKTHLRFGFVHFKTVTLVRALGVGMSF
jgi:GNAT superfamily N-acetyltransferase